MKWLLALALLAGVPALMKAHALPASTPARAFTLEIDAPEEVSTLLLRHLELLRYSELTDLSDNELERLLVSARQDTRELLATQGYFSPAIGIEQQAANTQINARRVKLVVTPGTPTLVNHVHIEFSGAIVNDQAAQLQRQGIEANWPLGPGMRFTQAAWDAAKQQALRELTAHRYPAGQLSASLADIDPVSHSARLSLTLESGPAYRLGPLRIEGTERYDAKLVMRLARLAPGTDYEQGELVQAQQRLTDSGFFESAFISLDTASEPRAAAVQVHLREAMLQKLVLGIGASTDSGTRLSAEHTHHQVPGLGWRAVSKLSLDRETHSIGTELTAPPDADQWRWVTSTLLQNQKSGSTDVGSLRLRVGRSQGGQRIDRNYYLQYDRADSAANDGSLPSLAQALSANYAFTVRNFDTLPFPSSGWGLGVEVGGGSTLGSQQDPYGRVLARWLGYLPLGRGSDGAPTDRHAGRLALRTEAGAVLAKEAIALPSTQLFLTGGDNSVRGYGYHDLGVTLPDGQTVAGRYLGQVSLEWQRPISVNGQWSDWESTVFIDAGAVANRVADLHAKLGVGVGARWKSPVGPLQIDLAYGVAVQRLRLHLNAGFAF